MIYIYPQETISDDSWHVMPQVTVIGARHYRLHEKTGTEQLDVAVSTDGGLTYGETWRTQPGEPFVIPGRIKPRDRVRVKRVSSNTIYVQASVLYLH